MRQPIRGLYAKPEPPLRSGFGENWDLNKLLAVRQKFPEADFVASSHILLKIQPLSLWRANCSSLRYHEDPKGADKKSKKPFCAKEQT
jgi:hypothetical protein